MNLLFLIALGVALGQDPGPAGDPRQWPARLAAVGVGVLLVAASARWLALWTVSRLQRYPAARHRVVTQYAWLARGHGLFSLTIYLLLVTVGGWSSVVGSTWGLSGWLIVDELFVLAPYLVAEFLSLAAFFRVDEAVRGYWTPRGHSELGGRWSYVDFHFRNQFGIWLVVGLWIVGAGDLVDWLNPDWKNDPVFLTATAVGIMGSVVLVSPWILRWVWRAQPLAPGTPRTQLEELARQMGFGYADILVWRTRGIANAAVTGLVPQLRYVLLSDTLLDEFTPHELEAVFGHEVGHIKHHHMRYYVLFIVLSVTLITFLTELLADGLARLLGSTYWESLSQVWGVVPPEFLLLIPYLFVVFGLLSRRFERQADIHGARAASWAVRHQLATMAGALEAVDAAAPAADRNWTLSPAGVETFIQSLEKVAFLNGTTRTLWSWRHGSIASRIEFLEMVAADPQVADRFESRLRRNRRLLLGGLILGTLLIVAISEGIG